MAERVDAVAVIQGLGIDGAFATEDKPVEFEMKQRSQGLTTLAVGLDKIAILQYPHSALTTVATESLDAKVNNKTLTRLVLAVAADRSNRECLGLSSNQIGDTHVRAFVLNAAALNKIDKQQSKHTSFVNPVIREVFGTASYLDESCMSFPASTVVQVKRYPVVAVDFKDVDGNEQTERYSGLIAQAIQHEIDHLNGITLYQHASSKQQKKIRIHIEHARTRRR